MTFKSVAMRLFNTSKTLTTSPFSSSATRITILSNSRKASIAPDPGDSRMFLRFLHAGAAFRPAILPEMQSLMAGDNFMERLRSGDRIQLGGLIPPKPEGLTVEDTKKVLKVAQLEMVKSRLREREESCISYSEFVRICSHGCSDPEQGLLFAKMLDQSACVIVLGNVVFLKPEQVTKTIAGLFHFPGTNQSSPEKKELEDMEMQMAEIDKEAKSLVRGELWCGLGFMVVQTAGLMRLTFWELSWDVMEPICFYITSIYFMMGYAFFLRTSIEPSFEGFFQSRFAAKQKRLIKTNNFDIHKYNQLKQAYNCQRMLGA